MASSTRSPVIEKDRKDESKQMGTCPDHSPAEVPVSLIPTTKNTFALTNTGSDDDSSSQAGTERQDNIMITQSLPNMTDNNGCSSSSTDDESPRSNYYHYNTFNTNSYSGHPPEVKIKVRLPHYLTNLDSHPVNSPPLLLKRFNRSASKSVISKKVPQENDDTIPTTEQVLPELTAAKHVQQISVRNDFSAKVHNLTRKYSSTTEPDLNVLQEEFRSRKTSTYSIASADSNVTGRDAGYVRGNAYLMKVKHDIISGTEYLTRKIDEQQMDLEKEMAANKELTAKMQLLMEENNELKIKFDESEKEVMTLKQRVQYQWQEKIHTQELNAKKNDELNKITKELKNALEEKCRELKTVQELFDVQKQNMAKVQAIKRSHAAEENWETLQKFARLEDELTKLRGEKIKYTEDEKKYKEEAETLKADLREKIAKLNRHYTSFISLKKSFNDVQEENEKLRQQLRHARAHPREPNNTWPKQAQQTELWQVHNQHRLSDTNQPILAHGVGLPAVRTVTFTTIQSVKDSRANDRK